GSTADSASWDEAFNMSSGGSQCNPLGGGNNVPGTSKGTFLSYQGAIYQVPAGTANVSFPLTTQAQFCFWQTDIPIGPQYETVSSQVTIALGPPVLQPNFMQLTIPAGGSSPLPVAAYIPDSNTQLQWTISSNQSWLTVPTNAPYSNSAIIPVQVAGGTPNGS